MATQTPPPPIFQYFEFDHLPEPLQRISSRFRDLAIDILDYTNPGPEQTVALRKLLESKDAAVRAALNCITPARE